MAANRGTSMKQDARILVVDDDPDIRLTAEVVLKQQFKTVHTCEHPEKIQEYFTRTAYEIVLLDMNYSPGEASGKDGLHWLGWLSKHHPAVKVIIITAYGEVNLAVEAMKLGAVDFVTKPWEYQKLQATVSAAWKLAQAEGKVSELQEDTLRLKGSVQQQEVQIIGNAPPMRELFRMIAKVAGTDANVLILGENGTGKELIAKALHQQSHRAGEVMVTVDLGSISEGIFESELFGHKKGSFTDAREDRVGRFEAAHRGTLFLDEIGNLSPGMQMKLLTAIQSKSIVRLGENVPRPVDVRILAATNMPLDKMIAENTFRQDLLYRLNTVELHIPPLRERMEDLPLLVDYFLEKYGRKYQRRSLSLRKAALNKLRDYAWPGNVRELEHVLERAVIMSEGGKLDADDILLRPGNSPEVLDITNLEELEKVTIQKVIARCQGNMSQAAKMLGLGRTTLYRKMERYGL